MWRQSVLMIFFAVYISHINLYRVNGIQEHDLHDQTQSDESNKKGNAPLDLEEVETKNIKTKCYVRDVCKDRNKDKFECVCPDDYLCSADSNKGIGRCEKAHAKNYVWMQMARDMRYFKIKM